MIDDERIEKSDLPVQNLLEVCEEIKFNLMNEELTTLQINDNYEFARQ